MLRLDSIITNYNDYNFVTSSIASSNMSLACSSKHKKPVCDKCTAGTNCTNCCMCQPRSRGRRRPRKEDSVSSDCETVQTPARSNPERRARIHPDALAPASAADDVTPSTTTFVSDDHSQHVSGSQAQILKVLEVMNCEEGYESSVRRLPSIDVRCRVQHENDLGAATMQRIDIVFRKGIKAWARMLLPHMKAIDGISYKNAFSITSLLAPMEETTQDEEGSEVHLSSVPSASIPTQVLDTIPVTIRDMLKCKKPYTSIDARTLLVTLADVPQAYIASLLTISNQYAGSLHFQAKVDKLYITKGVTLQEYRHSRSRVNSAMVNLAVELIYDDDNISRLAWEAKKRAPNRDLRWKGLANMFAMRSLVFKHDIATMYRHYLDTQRSVMPGMPPIGKTLFYTIANNITGGGKLQEARAGVDYLKVNFHSENFTIIDKVIEVLAPLSDIDHTLRDELLCLRSDMFTFLSYGFAVHVKSGVQASDDTVVQSREPQEHEAHQFAEYKKLGELLSQPDLFDEPATQESFIFQVQNQLNMCASIGGSVAELGVNNCCASTHSPAYALDLVPDRRPNMNPKLAGHMDCSACRGTFLFYDRLRRMALSKLDQDPTRLAEIANMLLSIHQCERRTFRYMAHVMLAAQQSHKMKQVIAEMDSSTAYVVLDFKQKFLAKGFREGGDSYYGKKGKCCDLEWVCTSSQTLNMPATVSLLTNSMWKWISLLM